MKIYRIAQTQVPVSVSIEQRVRVVREVFENLENVLGVKATNSQDGYLLDWSIERQDDATLGGTSYTQVSHNRLKDGFHVEIYFESEFLQDAYGKSVQVNCGYDNVNRCVHEIIKAIDKITRGT